MKDQQNKSALDKVFGFFSSIQLSLFVFFILAIASIIGTIIPQNKPPGFYIDNYGIQWWKIFNTLDVPDMYNSWWFVGLLLLLTINLIVCTIDRLPNVWRMVVMDNLGVDSQRIIKMPFRRAFSTSLPLTDAGAVARELLSDSGAPQEKAGESSLLLFRQKGAWTRLGVYAVHFSVIVIFAGAIIGTLYGYKGSVMIPEGGSSDKVYKFGSAAPIDLGFTVRCDRFSLTLYDTGAPKEFRSDLTVLENGREVYEKSIVVNDPMTFNGVTFYQASYEAMNNYLVHIAKENSEVRQSFVIPPGREVPWSAEGISFGILNLRPTGRPGHFQYKIWFSDGKGDPAEFWMSGDRVARIERPTGTYTFSLKQHFATGLQVTKDPGVWWVYIGCTAMLLGLVVAFFLSHQRVWVYITQQGERTRVVLSGTSNKNRVGFERHFGELAERFAKHERLNPTEEKI